MMCGLVEVCYIMLLGFPLFRLICSAWVLSGQISAFHVHKLYSLNMLSVHLLDYLRYNVFWMRSKIQGFLTSVANWSLQKLI